MGGEWYLSVLPGPLDLVKYQKILRQFKEQYGQRVPPGCGQFFDENPVDNIFAKFHYKCGRHTDRKDFTTHAVWYLLWNPNLEGSEALSNDTHGRCAPSSFYEFSSPMMSKLSTSFPQKFDYYLDYDDMFPDSYSSDNGMGYDQFGNREVEDFAACDAECGYCGHCHY